MQIKTVKDLLLWVTSHPTETKYLLGILGMGIPSFYSWKKRPPKQGKVKHVIDRANELQLGLEIDGASYVNPKWRTVLDAKCSRKECEISDTFWGTLTEKDHEIYDRNGWQVDNGLTFCPECRFDGGK